ncbi:hypothetical protein HNQ59_001826 [Chitinivorax tropicus]|uniref:DUF808 domain-containing protein n=1 Tax=Chitinivorax tropicus TaxID=714531 RepID=A0A840MNG9_9PROT|nr:DUF808 domain-containing protein [Chitinivorax tropicus]MBB5018537.1 hypothetical protein [Chitinivorax tropicus]
MAGTSLLALIDDIATLLDDVAVMTKVAAKKTAGVLGDDLALNAQQVAGVAADRELPVVWAVAKGSFCNKLILVPAALAISSFASWAVLPLLMIGGAYLCFEGFEKIAHQFLHGAEAEQTEHEAHLQAIADSNVDMVAYEKEKIKGAIRTDFILSAEIIVIALGTVAHATFTNQVAVLAGIGVIMTVGVYGLVAGIVKLDDLGYYLTRKAEQGGPAAMWGGLGRGLLLAAPMLMKFLSVAGTVAMFMVGGSILAHGVPAVYDFIHHASQAAGTVAVVGPVLGGVTSSVLDAVVGVVAGAVCLAVVTVVGKLISLVKPAKAA